MAGQFDPPPLGSVSITDAHIATTLSPSKITGTAATAADIATHAGLTTGIHGAGAYQLIYSSDSRLTDARVPTSHDNTKHSATYITQSQAEPPIGNPGTDGCLLASTAAGTRGGVVPGSAAVSQYDLGTFSIPTAGYLSQRTQLALSGTERAALTGTARVGVFDPNNTVYHIGSYIVPTCTLSADQYVMQYKQMKLIGNTRITLQVNSTVLLTDFAPGGRLVLSGRGF
jgi:hypothetical protein